MPRGDFQAALSGPPVVSPDEEKAAFGAPHAQWAGNAERTDPEIVQRSRRTGRTVSNLSLLRREYYVKRHTEPQEPL